jgi:hypothetical protein
MSDVIPTTELIPKLVSIGFDYSTIAALTGVSVRQIKKTLLHTPTTTESENIDLANQLTKKVLLKSFEILDIGHPDQQALVYRAVLSAAVRQYVAESDTTTEEVRMSIERIFSYQRSHDAIELSSLATGIDDSDEEA